MTEMYCKTIIALKHNQLEHCSSLPLMLAIQVKLIQHLTLLFDTSLPWNTLTQTKTLALYFQ